MSYSSADPASPLSIPLRDLHTPASTVLSSDFDRLLSDDEASISSHGDNLPPVDGGRQAWTCLLGCWVIEAMIWGFPLAFGIFQSHYSANPRFMASKSIPTIGTLATGISYLGMPFTNAICMRWPQHQRLLSITGFAICVASLIAASFATATWQLLLSQGALYGAGWVICYTPFLFMLNEWFVEKRGLAYGILFAASGVSGLIIPLAVGAIMDRFGFRTALRVFAVATLIIGGPGLFMIKPRTAYARSPGQGNEKLGHSTEVMAVLKSTHFLIFAAAIFLQGLGFFLPNVFLPSFASDLGLPSSAGSALLASISISQVVGQIGLGHVSDKMNPYIPTSFASCVSGLAVLFLWAPAKGMVKLVPFAVLWGLFSASYSVLYTRVCSSLVEDADVSMTVYGIFSFERGVANILEGPISAFLLGDEVDVDTYALGKYQGVAWFTGVCMLLSSLAVVGMLRAVHRI